MRESIGSLQMYNIIIIFFFVVIGFLFATIAYHRAFKINTIIVGSIEKYEGYNHLARAQIHQDLTSIAYPSLQGSNPRCPNVRPGDGVLVTPTASTENYDHKYCVYESPLEMIELTPGITMGYRQYAVVTYIFFDFPLMGDLIEIPIVARTNRIPCFGGGC